MNGVGRNNPKGESFWGKIFRRQVEDIKKKNNYQAGPSKIRGSILPHLTPIKIDGKITGANVHQFRQHLIFIDHVEEFIAYLGRYNG